MGKFEQFLERKFAAFFDDAPDFLLALGEFGQIACGWQGAHKQPFAPAGLFAADGFGQDTFQGGFRCATIIAADPAGELQDFGRDERLCADDFEDGFQPGVCRRLGQPGDAPEHFARAERNLDTAADVDLVGQLGGNEIIELLAERQFQGDAGDHLKSGMRDSSG